MWLKLEPKDLICVIALIGGIVALALGQEWGWALVGGVLLYYGIDLSPWIPVGRIRNDLPGGSLVGHSDAISPISPKTDDLPNHKSDESGDNPHDPNH